MRKETESISLYVTNTNTMSVYATLTVRASTCLMAFSSATSLYIVPALYSPFRMKYLNSEKNMTDSQGKMKCCRLPLPSCN